MCRYCHHSLCCIWNPSSKPRHPGYPLLSLLSFLQKDWLLHEERCCCIPLKETSRAMGVHHDCTFYARQWCNLFHKQSLMTHLSKIIPERSIFFTHVLFLNTSDKIVFLLWHAKYKLVVFVPVCSLAMGWCFLYTTGIVSLASSFIDTKTRLCVLSKTSWRLFSCMKIQTTKRNLFNQNTSQTFSLVETPTKHDLRRSKFSLRTARLEMLFSVESWIIKEASLTVLYLVMRFWNMIMIKIVLHLKTAILLDIPKEISFKYSILPLWSVTICQEAERYISVSKMVLAQPQVFGSNSLPWWCLPEAKPVGGSTRPYLASCFSHLNFTYSLAWSMVRRLLHQWDQVSRMVGLLSLAAHKVRRWDLLYTQPKKTKECDFSCIRGFLQLFLRQF